MKVDHDFLADYLRLQHQDHLQYQTAAAVAAAARSLPPPPTLSHTLSLSRLRDNKTDTRSFKMHATSTFVSLLSMAAAASAAAFPHMRRAGTTANGTNVVNANWDGCVSFFSSSPSSHLPTPC